MPHLRVDQYLAILFIAVSCIFLGSYQQVAAHLPQIIEDYSIQLVEPSLLPVQKATSSAQLASQQQKLDNLSAQAIYIYDLKSGAVLYEKNAHLALPPASTTKIMTALIAGQIYESNRIFSISQAAYTQGNTMDLQVGEKISVKDLMAGLLIASANDAAFVFANQHPQGYSGFIKAMNQLASDLNLENTQFKNPSGLDQEDHYLTARDLTILAKELLKNSYFRSLVATKQLKVVDLSTKIVHNLYNTNALLDNELGVKGVKTGTTDAAGQVLVTYLDKNGKELIIVVMGSINRYIDTTEAIDWVFENYQWQDIDNNYNHN